MKKIFLFIVFMLCCSNFNTFYFSNASEKDYYGKIENENIYLYSSPESDLSKALFQIPKSYFVKLLDDAGENFYYASYKNTFGYVNKKEVSAMLGTPLKPFANATFRTFSLEGIGLYSNPSTHNSTKISTIPYLTNSLSFYGYIVGEELIPEKTNQWIYCNYNNDTFGYVYSVFCDQLSPIPSNNETFTVVDTPIFNVEEPVKTLSNLSMIFIIIGVTIPCLIVIYLLLKPTFIKDKLLNEKPKHKRKRHKDYFEFDDTELN